MNEEIKQYLKDNLRIEISAFPSFGDGIKIRVSLFLEGEEISNDSDTFHLSEFG